MMKEKIIGILGGMGPYATIDMFLKIVKLTPAKKDWEHLRIIIDNNPKIPSRTRAILFGEASPVDGMIDTARNLERAGADFIIVPCNSAHYFLDQVQENVNIPIVSIIGETCKEVLRKIPQIRRIGLLAGTVTVNTSLYQKAFLERGVSVITPHERNQEKVVEIIETVKLAAEGTDTLKKAKKLGEQLVDQGSEAIILGCTELSIIMKEEHFNVPVFDSNLILAKSAVNIARGGQMFCNSLSNND